MTTEARFLWYFNMDAEYELARGDGYTTPRALRARIDEMWPRTGLVDAARDRVLTTRDAPDVAAGAAANALVGMAWCPTPRALRALAAAGAARPRSPDASVLRRVVPRSFFASLTRPRRDDARRADPASMRAIAATSDEVAAHIARYPRVERWRLKTSWGFAARGHRVVTGGAAGDDAWIRRALRSDVLVVEPELARLDDVALHGLVDPAGRVVLGKPTFPVNDAAGQWLRSAAEGGAPLTPSEHAALYTHATWAAGALFDAGYFGPFGIDAFRFVRDRESGDVDFEPCCEINARFTMGWALGMGPTGRAALEAYAAGDVPFGAAR